MGNPQNLLSPSVHKHNPIGSNRLTVAIICAKHGFFRAATCPKCSHNEETGPAVHTDEWVKSTWEHIGPEPIKIESKEHLFRECEKRGVIPRAFMKPKSSGPGFEIARR